MVYPFQIRVDSKKEADQSCSLSTNERICFHLSKNGKTPTGGAEREVEENGATLVDQEW